MRRQAQVSIMGKGGKTIKVSVFELSVKQIRDLISVVDPAVGRPPDSPAGGLTDARFMEMVAMGTDLDWNLVIDEEVAPSDLKTVYDAFVKINSDFLSLARSLGLLDLAGDLIRKLLTGVFAGLSDAAIAALGSMGMPSLSSVSDKQTSSEKSGSGTLQ
jgi:hypothetical protein